jgi:hypothetical protein
MATRAVSEIDTGTRGVKLFKWTGITSSDDAGPLSIPAYADKTFQVTGAFGAATVSIQGSMDNSTYAVLHSFDATDATGIANNEPIAPMENTLYVKPVFASMDGTTDLTVWCLAITPRG